jgi:Bacterial Ig-like domain
MNQIKKYFATSACALATSLLVTACGGGGASAPADTIAPTVTITDSVATATATGAVTFTFTFSESVGTSFTVDDITVTGGTKGAFTMVSTTQATLVVVPTANAIGTITVTVDAAKFSDTSSNANIAAATATQNYNTQTTSPAATAQTITFAPAATGTVGIPITLAATSTSALAVAFSSTTPLICTVSGTTLTLLSSGTCTVKADQAGNSAFAAAAQASANITVSAVAVIDPNAINFETGGKGAAYTWSAFDNLGAAPAVVANPSATGINTSSKVLQFSQALGAWYTGMESKHGAGGTGSDLGTTAMTSANALVKMKVYKPLISDVGFKLVSETGASEGDVRVANTKVNVWEELTFNFCNKISAVKTIDQVVIFPDFNQNPTTHTNTSVSYVDDITFNACPVVVVAVPTTAPATPTALTANVISLYSDGYTSPLGTDTPNWGQGVVLTNEFIASNNVLKLANFNYQGVQFLPQDVSTFSKLHVDLWSATATTIEIKLVSLSPAPKETAIFIPVVANAWTSTDIDLTLFTAPDRTKLEQLILAAAVNGGTLYVDNLYFWK